MNVRYFPVKMEVPVSTRLTASPASVDQTTQDPFVKVCHFLFLKDD